jgi:olefin beta-lactone synthetase
VNDAQRATPTEDRNIAVRLRAMARRVPGGIAIAEPDGPPPKIGPRSYRATTFAELDRESDQIAAALLRWGVPPGTRLALLVPYSTQMIRLVLALLKAGMVLVLVDPGMGRKNLVACLEEAQPEGFVGIPRAQVVRAVLRRRFAHARWNVTVGGRRWFWGGTTLARLQRGEGPTGALPNTRLPVTPGSADAAVIFTTGSTGPPKGVLYTHDLFHHQVDLIRDRYGIRPGSRDLACFPLFGLFDALMGVTTILPDMDPTRPADVDPRRILEAVEQWEIDQAFGSPALWNTVTRWCLQHDQRLPTLRRVLSAGAPVPADTLARLREIVHPEAEIFTPYGATEALPIASIESREVLEETAAACRAGRGTCVGTPFESIQWRVIAIDDGPLPTIEQTRELPRGEVGELMVSGPVVTERYVTRTDQNALHKVREGERVWHRMGDVGYLDEKNRFWFCGRKSHRVRTAAGLLLTEPIEAIFNTHQDIARSALVGIGEPPQQHPVVVVEPLPERVPRDQRDRQRLIDELRGLAARHEPTRAITDIRIHPDRLPVDIRHNSKIFREQIAVWAARHSEAR